MKVCMTLYAKMTSPANGDKPLGEWLYTPPESKNNTVPNTVFWPLDDTDLPSHQRWFACNPGSIKRVDDNGKGVAEWHADYYEISEPVKIGVLGG